MALWQHQRYVYALQWTGLWPLIGVALTQERLTEAMNYVRILLASTQQRPPKSLYPLLEATVQAWDRGQWNIANAILQEALPLAHEMGYLLRTR
jgi:hypothetical protein